MAHPLFKILLNSSRLGLAFKPAGVSGSHCALLSQASSHIKSSSVVSSACRRVLAKNTYYAFLQGESPNVVFILLLGVQAQRYGQSFLLPPSQPGETPPSAGDTLLGLPCKAAFTVALKTCSLLFCLKTIHFCCCVWLLINPVFSQTIKSLSVGFQQGFKLLLK